MEILFWLCFSSLLWYGRTKILRGHLGKLGEQGDPAVITTELYSVPQPRQFFKDFVNKNRPVVFRGAAKKSRSFTLWTEEYLKKEYGNVTVRLEARSEDNNRMPVGSLGLGLDLLGNFIDHYQSLDGYIISQVPKPMERDIMIPPCLRCGSFEKSIQEVHIFLSASGGKTALHKDPYNNIHCVFNGTKDWISVHPDQTELVYMSPDSEFEWGGLSDINVDEVDLQQYPNVARVNYSKVRLHKGDCIFMPAGYWHQVRSWGYLNSAISIWFSIIDKFDDIGCGEKVVDFTAMSDVDVLWRYPGIGNLTQGHMDIYVLQKALLLWADENKVIWLHSFADYFFTLMGYNAERKAMSDNIKERKEQFIRYLDVESEGYTTSDIISGLNITQLKHIVELFHPNDISNTDMLEYGHIEVESIRTALFGSLRDDGIFDQNYFLQQYVEELGGTEEKASQILTSLDIQDGAVSKEHILSNLDKALEKYLNALTHDPATEKRIYQFLKFGKRNFNHDEL